jgi:hypothetical protein
MTIEITEVRNAQSMNAENTQFDVEINHPDYGWIPYSIHPSDTDMTIDNTALLSLIGSDYTPFSQADHDARVATMVRVQRDSKLTNEVDPVVSNPLRWADLSAQEQADVSAYRMALLDVPQQQGFPHTVSWPTKPACL